MPRLIDLSNDITSLRDELKKLSSDLVFTKETLLKLSEQATKNSSAFQAGNKTRKETSDLIKKTADNAKQLTEAEKAQEKIQRDIAKTLAATNAEQSKQGKNLARFKSQRQELNKIEKESIALQKAEVGSIAQLTIQNKKLTRERNNLSTATKQGRKRIAEINATLNKNNQVIKQNSSALEKQKGNIGNYKSALGGLGGAIKSQLGMFVAWGAAITGAAKVLKNSIKTIASFEQETTNLASVLGKTRSEITPLIQSAKELGATTAKSSSEVVKLQQAYARLGFSQSEIIDLTKGTIDGSIALNAELEETANLTGVVVKSFDDLKTTDADSVLDTLTLSTQKTALSFDKLNTAIPIVGGAADAAGVSFESMVAQLGAAADRGIDASTAATSLRNIYLELSKKGLTLDEALTKINTSQDKLSTANELFGKRAAVTALALASSAEKTGELTTAFENAGGTAERVAKQQLNTLQGSVTLLKSAWEGLVLNVDRGNGFFKEFIRTITFVVEAITKWVKVDASTEIVKERKAVFDLVGELKKGQTTQERRVQIYDELKKKHPAIVDGVDAENIEMGKLATNLKAYNLEASRKIILSGIDSEEQKILGKQEKLRSLSLERQTLILSGLSQIQSQELTPSTRKLVEEYEKFAANLDIDDAKGFSELYTRFEDLRKSISKVERKGFDDLLLEVGGAALDAADSHNVLSISIENNSNKMSELESRRLALEKLLSKQLPVQEIEDEQDGAANSVIRERIELEQIKGKTIQSVGETVQETIQQEIEGNSFALQLANDYLLAYKERNLAILENEAYTQEEKARLLNESSILYLENLIEQDELILEQETMTAEARLAIMQALTDKKIELSNLKADIEKQNEEGVTEKTRAEAQKRIEITRKTTDAIATIGQGLFNYKSQLLRNEEIAVENRVKQGVISEEQGAKEIAAIKKKQAEQQKAQAIFSAVVNTATGITGALSALPGPAGIALAVIVGILGALQIAAIASEPIPEFAKGVKGFEGGAAIYGEKGREIIELPDGSSYLAAEPTIGYLPKGANVIPNWETEKILQGGGESNNPGRDVVVKNDIVTYSTSITGRGMEYAQIHGSTKIKYENKYFKK